MEYSDNAFPAAASRQRGFTLLELAVTLVIAGIVTAVGLPALTQFMDNGKISSSTNLLLGSIGMAKETAINDNVRVAMCRSTNGTSCAADGDWRDGWIVFIDGETVGTKDAKDTILAVQSALTSGGPISSKGNVANYISFLYSGKTRTVAGAELNGSLTVCATSPKVKRKRLTFEPGSGIPTVTAIAGASVCTS
jgi:type IV fimbrial biogenesis protein FimT